MKRTSLLHGLVLVIAATAGLASCGGGASGGTGGAGTGGGPTQASGVLSAFGSIVVNGIEYTTGSSTAVVDGDADDAAASMGALQVGMTVDVDASAGGASAARVRFTSAVRGEVDAVDAAASTITVLGQTVQVTSATSFAGTNAAQSAVTQLGNVQVGDYVVVYGFLECTASGTNGGGCTATQVVATLVYEPGGSGVYRVEGYARNVNAAGNGFTIDGLTVVIATTGTPATVCSPSPCAITEGELVAVRAASAPAIASGALTLTASRIVATTQLPVYSTGATVSLAGPVSGLDAGADLFDVRGVVIDGSALAPTVATLSDGEIVTVTGTVAADGSIVATSIAVQQHATFALLGPLGSDSASADTLTVLGQTFKLNSATRFVDWAQGVRPFNLGNFATVLQAGDQLIVSGYVGAGGDVATRVERVGKPATPTVGVQGVVSADAGGSGTLTVGGIEVTLSASTALYYPGAETGSGGTLSGFFAALTVGSTVVSITGTPGSGAGSIDATTALALPTNNLWVGGPH
jgi:hypothetical protein